MRVTIVPVERKRSVCAILVDEEEWRQIHTDIFGKKPEIPAIPGPEELAALVDLLELQGVRKYVLNKLSRRSYPSAELEKLLAERLVSEPTVNRILTECRQYGYINDEEWTERFISAQMRKGQGPHVIQQKLRAKGVSAPALPNEQLSQIQALLQTKYRTKNLKDPKERQKVVASLARRGFDFDAIRAGLDLPI